MRIPKLLATVGVTILSVGVFNFQSVAQDSKVDPQKLLDKDAEAQRKLHDAAHLEELKRNGIEFTPNPANTNAPAPVVKTGQAVTAVEPDVKKQAADDAAKRKAEARETAKKKASEAEAKKKEAAERAETAKIEARLAAKQKLAAQMAAKHKAAEAKAAPGSKVADKSTAPPPASGSREARLAELLQLYKSDKLTPAEYHDQRAKILDEP